MYKVLFAVKLYPKFDSQAYVTAKSLMGGKKYYLEYIELHYGTSKEDGSEHFMGYDPSQWVFFFF